MITTTKVIIVKILFPVQFTHKRRLSFLIVFLGTSSSEICFLKNVENGVTRKDVEEKVPVWDSLLKPSQNKAKEPASFSTLPYSSRLGKHSISKQLWRGHHVSAIWEALISPLMISITHIYVKWSRRRVVVGKWRLEKRREVHLCQLQSHATAYASL